MEETKKKQKWYKRFIDFLKKAWLKIIKACKSIIAYFKADTERRVVLCVIAFVLFVVFYNSLANYFFAESISPKGELLKVLLTFIVACGGLYALLINNRRVRAIEKGNVDTRYSNAVGHLASANPTVVLGGIHALHAIAKENTNYIELVHDLFCSYLRENSKKIFTELNLEKGIYLDKLITNYSKLSSDERKAIPFSCPVVIQAIVDYLFKPDSSGKCVYAKLKANLQGSYLISCNFNNTVIDGANFTQTILLRSDFMYATISDSIFMKTTISDSIFWKAKINSNSYFRDTTISDSNFSEAKISNSHFEGTNISNSNFSSAAISDSNFNNAEILGSKFEQANISKSYFNNAIISGSSFFVAKISGSSFSVAKISDSKFPLATISDSDFWGATISKSDFISTVISDSDFSSTVISDSKFIEATISKSDFEKATISNSNFSYSTISKILFCRAKISGSEFISTRFRNIIFDEATDLSTNDFTGAYSVLKEEEE